MNIHKWQQKEQQYMYVPTENGLCNFNNIFHWIWLFNFDINTITMPYYDYIANTLVHDKMVQIHAVKIFYVQSELKEKRKYIEVKRRMWSY